MNLKKTRIPWTNLRESEKIYKARSKFKFVELTEMEQEYIVRELLWDKLPEVMDDK